MSRRSRFLLIAMSTAFGIAALGLISGICYDLYLVSVQHVQLENALGSSIAYNKFSVDLEFSGWFFSSPSCFPPSPTRNRTNLAK